MKYRYRSYMNGYTQQFMVRYDCIHVLSVSYVAMMVVEKLTITQKLNVD